MNGVTRRRTEVNEDEWRETKVNGSKIVEQR